MEANRPSGYLYPTPGSSSSQPQGNVDQGHLDMGDFDVDMIDWDEFDQAALSQPLDNNQPNFNEVGYNQPEMIQGTYNASPFNQPVSDHFGPELDLNNATPNQASSPIAPAVGQASVSEATMDLLQQPLSNEGSFAGPDLHLNNAALNQAFGPVAVGQANVAQPSMNLPQQLIVDEASSAAAPENNLPANGYAHAGKTITQMMEEDTSNTFQGYVLSHTHAEQLEAEYTQQASAAIAATIRPESLADIPDDDDLEKRNEWRKKIFDAIRDFRNVVNKPRENKIKDKNGNVIRTEWIENTHVRRVRQMKGATTELIGDKILKLAINAQRGIGGIPPWVDKKAWKLETFPSFAARMNYILEGLRTNKSIAHAFIDVDPTKRFAAAPKAEVRVKKDNIDGNGKKGGLISDGREARQNKGN